MGESGRRDVSRGGSKSSCPLILEDDHSGGGVQRGAENLRGEFGRNLEVTRAAGVVLDLDVGEA